MFLRWLEFLEGGATGLEYALMAAAISVAFVSGASATGQNIRLYHQKLTALIP